MTYYETAIARFREWFELAHETEGITDPTAMALATADTSGRPGVRTVLLKQVDEAGFVFYTNTRSQKGMHLAANPYAALDFYWAPLARQVVVEGRVQTVSDDEADAYFASRPRLSQIGAWASNQSEPLADREAFEARLAEVEARFGDGPISRPPHWTGYRLRPDRIEFWQGRDGRLHDRERYYRSDSGDWEWLLLNP